MAKKRIVVMRRDQILHEQHEILCCRSRNMIVKAGFATLINTASPTIDLNEDLFLELLAKRLGKKIT